MSNNYKQCHKRTSLTYRKGRTRLRPLSIRALTEICEREKSGKRYDAAQKELARKHKIGIVWHAPDTAEATEE